MAVSVPRKLLTSGRSSKKLSGTTTTTVPGQTLPTPVMPGFGWGYSQGGKGYGYGSGYDATTFRGRRRNVGKNLKSEDRLLKQVDRDSLISQTRSLLRNSSVFAWALRRHLDNIATYTFMCRSGNRDFDNKVEALMDWWSRPLNCNVTGRHDLYQLIRMWESMKCVDGDVFIYKLDDGRLQTIEGDCIRTPTNLGGFAQYADLDVSQFIHGVRVDSYGKPLAYAICRREENEYVLDELVSAEHVFHYAEFTRMDQVRGVSQMASAVTTFIDLYEAKEFALSKMKLAQIFTFMIKRGENSNVDDAETDSLLDGYNVDMSGGGSTLELDPGDDAEVLESKNPSTEFQSFFKESTIQALKAFDLPFSFYAENFTNYSGARQALVQYEQAADIKRDILRSIVLNNLTVWRLGLFMADGHLELPDGMTMDDIKFTWVGSPLPWIDPMKEASANIALIDAKLTSRTRICKAQGLDFQDIVNEQAQEQQYAADAGVDLGVVDTTTMNEAIAKADALEAAQVGGQDGN